MSLDPTPSTAPNSPVTPSSATSVARSDGGVLKNSMINSGLTLVSRFMGLARDFVITAALGASSNIFADAYATAINFPNLWRRIFAEGAFTAAFVPAYTRTLEDKGQAEADRLARDALAVLAAATLVLTLGFQLAMPWLMNYINPGYVTNPDKFKLAVILTQISMPYLPCMAIVALLSGVLNARGRFVASAAAPTLLNLVMLIMVLPAKTAQDAAYMASYGILVAGIVQALMLIWAVRRVGAKIGFAWPKLTPEIKALIAIAIPGAFAASATQINVFVSQNLASHVDGARAWMMCADRLYQLPLGLVGVAIGVALLPTLSRAVQRQDRAEERAAMDQAVVLSMALTAPAAAALLAIPFFLIDGLFTRGEFTLYDSQQTGAILFHYGWGVPAFVLSRVLTPAFFARRDTKTPMIFAMASVVLNVGLCYGLYPSLKIEGLAIATSASAWLNVGLMVITLMIRGHWTMSLEAQGRLFKVILACGLMAGFCYGCDQYRSVIEAYLPHYGKFGQKEIAILATCFAGLFVYLAALLVFGGVTISEIKSALRRKPASKDEGQSPALPSDM